MSISKRDDSKASGQLGVGLFTKDFSSSLAALAAMHELSSQRQAMMSVTHTFDARRPKAVAMAVTRRELDKVKDWKDRDLNMEVQDAPTPVKFFGKRKTLWDTGVGQERRAPPEKGGRVSNMVLHRKQTLESLRVTQEQIESTGMNQTTNRVTKTKSVVPALPILQRKKSLVSDSTDSPSKQFIISSSRKASKVQTSNPGYLASYDEFMPRQSSKLKTTKSSKLVRKSSMDFKPKDTGCYVTVFPEFKVNHLKDYQAFPLEKFDPHLDAHFNYEHYIQTHQDAHSRWLNLDGSVSWEACWVNDYHPATCEFTIRWKHNLKTKKVKRMNIAFEGQVIEDFENRRKSILMSRHSHLVALSLRDAALSLETVPPCRVIYSTDQLQRIVQK